MLKYDFVLLNTMYECMNVWMYECDIYIYTFIL